MKSVPFLNNLPRLSIVLVLLLAVAPAPRIGLAQAPAAAPPATVSTPAPPQFRLERLPVAGGAELITIFGRLDGMANQAGAGPDVPLVSIVRDTLGDANPENDRLRYVWMLTYTSPT